MKAKNKSTSKPRCSKNQDRWQYSGSAVDQGNSGRSCSRVGSLPSLGSSCKRNRRYPKGSSLLRLAVSITLKHRALASAPLAVSQNKKFLLAITNGLTVRSATLFVSSSLPSSRTASNCFLWCSEYVCAFCRFESFSEEKLERKSGATFYLVIDRNAKGQQTVHFMNLVDEADLLLLWRKKMRTLIPPKRKRRRRRNRTG